MSDDLNPRFDIVFHEHGPSLDFHFCREWDGDIGCYGTNPDHGYSFKEAALEMSRWHATQAGYWATVTLEEWGHMPPQPHKEG